MNYNGEITARACFVRIGRDPDEDPKLLGEIQRALEDAVDSAYILFARPAAEYEEREAAIGEAIMLLDKIGRKGYKLEHGDEYDRQAALARLRALGKG